MSRSKHLSLLGTLVLTLGICGPAGALTLSFFENGSYVDIITEGPSLRATLEGLGHTVNGFTGITAVDFAAATTGVSVLVFPEMELGDLNTDIDAAARAALLAFVTGGGHIVQANYFPGNSSLPNAVFGWALGQLGGVGDTFLDAAAAAGTDFAGGPGTAPGSDAVESISGATLASITGGALNIYHNEDQTSVFTASVGAGCYTYLGFDWFEDPTPAAWTEITGRAITGCGPGAAVVPEPASVALLGLGLAGLGFSRRKKA